MYTLRAIDSAGNQVAVLTDFSKLQCNVEFSEVGSCSFDYAVNGINSNLLEQQIEMAVFDDDQEVPDTRFVIEGANGNLVQREGVTYRNWSGRNLWKLFEESCTYPPNWPTVPPTSTVYNNQTPGYILRTLIQDAQGRGELTGITRNFTDTLDADGNAWDFSISVTFEVGVPLIQIIQWMVEQGFIEARMVGRELEVYNPDGLGQDRTLGVDPMVFWSAGAVEEVPEAVNSRELRTVALVVGDEGAIEEVVDATAVAQYGRRVLPIKQGGVKDSGTLVALGQLNLDRVKTPRRERTTKLAVVSGEPKPMFDYMPGDWIFSQTKGTPEKLRIRQLVIDVPSTQTDASVTLRLNDKFEELEVELNRKIEGITGGSQLGGGGTGVPSDEEADTMPPAIPTGLGLTSITYVQGGITAALLEGSWNVVTTNQDGSPITDFDSYRFAWRYMDEPLNASWHVVSNGDDTTAIVSGLIPGRNVQAKVGAVDRNGNFSGWSSTVSVALATDTSPPPTPSTPQVQAYLGQLRVFWDGLGSLGEVMPTDFMQIEIHVSQVNDFVPSGSTLVGSMTNSGYFVVTDLTYGVPYYVKFVARDRNQNASAPSAQGSATPQPVSGADLADGAVFLNHLAFSDVGNFIEDGSFENTDIQTIRPVGGPWSFVTDQAYQGSYSVKAPGSGALSASNNLLSAHVPVRPGDDFMVTFAARLDAAAWNSMAADTQAVGVQLVVRLASGSTTATSIYGPRKQDLTPDAWLNRFSVKIASASDWRAIEEVYLWRFSNVTAGSIWVDAFEFRQLLGSVHIANLAVNDALVANLSAGKIISGVVNADMLVGGRIVAGNLIGNRVDMDDTGLRLFKNAATSRTASDTFTRVASNQWGTIPSGSPTGQVWSPERWYGTTWGGSTNDFDVDGSCGLMALPNAATSESHDSASAVWPQDTMDTTVEAEVYIPEVATGASYRVGVMMRRSSVSPFDHGGLEIELNTSGGWTLRAYRLNAGVKTTTTLQSGAYSPGWYKIKGKLTLLGANTDIAGKFWQLGGTEPGWSRAGNSSYPQVAGRAGIWASRALGNTNSGLIIKWDNVNIAGYLTGAEETVKIGISGAAMFIGEIRTGYLTEKRIRIDANATFNSESGITFDDPSNSDDYSPTVFANYATFDGAGLGGLHLMSGEVTANSSGRARLGLNKGGGWRLGSEFGSDGDGNIYANDQVHMYARNTFGASVTSAQTFHGDAVSFGVAITGYTHTWGPTMDTALQALVTMRSGNLVRHRISSQSTTSYGITCDNTGGGSSWSHWAWRM